MKKIIRDILIAGVAVTGAHFALQRLARTHAEDNTIDDDNLYLASHSECESDKSLVARKNVYRDNIKPALDKILSFIGLVILSPVFLVISVAVWVDDPGPIFFAQKRVGKDGKFFMLHKFRSMKMSTPHDVPTHKLSDPEQYITRVGRVLRRTSLDELPQIWDIFRGRMSIIGPRPALWNQDDLVTARARYGANNILPGLTGLAQIRGRDELLIPVKAKLDGEYTRVLEQGGLSALFFDVKMFCLTIGSVLKHDGVVEGGTGALHDPVGNFHIVQTCGLVPPTADAAGFEDYGFKKKFSIDRSARKKVLITGAGSYIGESFKTYCANHYPNIECVVIDMVDGSWREKDFSDYDSVFHVAGIAHADVGSVSPEQQKKYYEVNTDLALETCQHAKNAGVSQFIFMSSMIVYGDSAPYGQSKVIDEHTIPSPTNFYGDSKWQADKGVRELQTDTFHVAVLRPPMIYGRGSKGNYPALAKLARRLPIFPDVQNERSMLYIENLCEFVGLLVLSGEGGIYFPQNSTFTKTSDIVKLIGQETHNLTRTSRLFNPAVFLAGKIPGKVSGLVNKAFGSSVYSQRLSQYEGLNYCTVSLEESIRRTEGTDAITNISCDSDTGIRSKKRVLILVNHDVVIYNFRLELVERLLHDGYEVHFSSPKGEHTQDLIALGAHFHEVEFDRHGMNPFDELRILVYYKRLIALIQPRIVLTYTVKCNVYGGIAARAAHIPFIANITGLGTTVNGGGVKEALVLTLYKIGLRGAQRVFFQNEDNKNFMVKNNVVTSPYTVLPGSGVNLSTHCFEPYPTDDEHLIFTTIGRIMKDKGTDELLEAAREIIRNHPSVTFRLIGFFDDDYEEKIKKAEEQDIISYIPQQRDIHPWIVESHAIIQPSHHEGMSNVLLEASATGRPVLASDIPGCRESFDKESGIGFEPRNCKDLVRAIEEFIKLPHDQKAAMGKVGRAKMEREFNREFVIDKYMEEINMAAEEKKIV